MLKAIVRLSDLSLMGTYDDEVTHPVEDGFVHIAMHPSLIGRSVVVVMDHGEVRVRLHPSEASLEDMKSAKKHLLDRELHAYVEARYTGLQRDAIMRQIDLAEKNSLTNKLAYCQQFEAWINETVLAYYVGKDMELDAASTQEELEAISWSYDELNASDPDVKIAVAYSITD